MPQGKDLDCGSGQGAGRGRNNGGGIGAGSICFCAGCGHKFPHDRGVKCTNLKCSECGRTMVRGTPRKQKKINQGSHCYA